MMRRLLVLGSSCFAAVLVFVAQTSAHSYKWFLLYEPDIPESLR
ncbi:Staphylococcal AgrD [Syntrophomonas zehnderi OL-4]|uniref:Staphylococcal AgrD n=1 Tax=Syntrophomonas zehnderi OL-4 TaxID=690567 RepID=A0A0E4G8U2_9FIRM|nr:Staphylococcal AgrD [Syntrophomonas zehnderi OL-4]